MEYFQSPGIRNQENAHIFSAPELYIVDPEYGSCMDFLLKWLSRAMGLQQTPGLNL